MKELAGECPRGIVGPGDDVGIGLGTWSGFDGEFAKRPELGDGCGSIEGDGLMLGGREGGEARLNDVAGLDPKLWCCVDWNAQKNN